MPIRRFASSIAIIVAGALFATSGPMGTVAANADPPPKPTAPHSSSAAPSATNPSPANTGPANTSPAETNPATTVPTSPISTAAPKQPTADASPTTPAKTSAPSGAKPSAPAPAVTPNFVLPPCSPNSTDTSIPDPGGPRCIAGLSISTRRTLGYVYNPATASYTSVRCVSDPRALVPNATYNIVDCKPLRLQAENIAQNRVIAQLNAAGVYGDSAATGVTANLQWETILPNPASPTKSNRPDLLLYDRTKAAGPVGLVEMKGNWSTDDPVAEVTKYVADWPAGGHPAAAYHFSPPISDDFKVQLEPACKDDPTKHSYYQFHTYSDPANDGVIRISRTKVECPPRQRGSDQDEKNGGYQGTIGVDADHNGVDDIWDFVRDHPELWYLTGPILAPAFHPLPKPVMVSLNRDALTALEEATEDAAPDAIDAEWAALIESLPQEVAAAGADIAAGDAAALGLDAAELAAAEVAMDAGFVTLSALFLAPVIAAAILLAIWAMMHWHLFGDPHMTTLDGLAYDLQDQGEFEVVHVPSLNLDVQARFLPQGSSRTFTVVDSVAFSINGSYVELNQDGDAVVNGVPIPSSQKLTDFGQGAVLVRNGNKFVATFGAGNARLAFGDSSLGFDIAPGVPTTGLLGNNDGIPGNDLVTSDGTPITSPTAAVIDGTYANSWRLTDNQSDFTYDDGMDTAAYTDLTFPSNVVTLADFAQSDQDLARQACNAQAVPAGPQFDACMLDVAQTGDANYAKAAAAVTDVLQDSAAHTVDAAGTVTENFESAIGSNFRPDSTESIGGTTTAGPVFDGSGYSFTVPSLPDHSGATVAFDVYAIGLTSANAQNQTLTVKVGDPATSAVLSFTPTTASVSSGPATLTALGQGQTTQGAPYQRYRITMTTPQYSDELKVQLTPSGFRGLIGTSLAVDNIAVGVTLVPAQTFAAALPLAVTAGTVDGTAAAGAGTLENTGSADVYSFTVPSGGLHLNLSMGSCPTASQADISWTLATAAGRTTASGGCYARDLGLVAAGQYTLTVGGPGVVGSYTVNVEAPQSFAATVPLSVTANTVNGTATTGAGVFEDGASQDTYSFTVPAGGAQLALSLRSCPASDNYSPGTWKLLDAATQTVVHAGYGGCSYSDFGTLPAGSYTLLVAANGTPGPYTLDLLSPQVFAVTLPLTTTANTLNGASTPGASYFETGASQDAYTFTVPSDGQFLNLDVTTCPTAGYSTPLRWKLVSTATGATAANGGCSYSNLGPLAAGGYRLVVSAGGVAGGYALNLEAPQSFATTLPLAVSPNVVNGAAAAGAGRFETVASQDMYTLTAPSDGSPVLLNIASCPTVDYSTALTWRLLDGTGTAIAHGQCGVASLGVLAAGSYLLAVDSGGMVGTYSLFATAGGAGTPAATLDGTPDVVTTTIAAQSVAIGFVNPASQTVAVTGSSTLTNGDCDYSSLVFHLYDHAGAEVTHGTLQCGSAGMLYSPVLPAGSYTVLIVPPAPVTGKLGVQVFGASSTAVTATLDGAPASVTTTAASQSAVVSFTVPASQAVTITGSATISSGDCDYTSVKFYLYDHSGAQVKSGSVSCGSAGVLYSPTLAAGSYQMLIAPPGPVTGTYGIQVFGAGASMATAALDGTPASVTTTTAAKSVAVGFTLPADQAVTVTGSAVTIGDCDYTSVKFYLYDHSGTQVSNGSLSCGSSGLLFGKALTAGAYTVVAVPPGPVTGTYGVQVFGGSIPAVATLDGTPKAVTTTVASQAAAVRFTVPSSQAVTIAGYATITSGDCDFSSVKFYLYDSTGTQLKNQNITCGTAGALYGVTLAAGSYTVVAVPPGPVLGTYGVQVFGATPPVTAALDGTPASVTTTIASRSVGIGFTVPTAQTVTISGSSATTGDCNYSSVHYYLYDHTGTQLNNTSLSCGSADALFAPTLAAGTYTLLIVPPGPVTGTYEAQVFGATAASATAALTGAPVSATTTVASRSVAFGFTVPTSQAVTITGSAAITGNCNYSSVHYYLYDSTGTKVKNTSLTCSTSGQLFTATLAAGSYKVLIVPPGPQTGKYGAQVFGTGTSSATATENGPLTSVKTTVAAQAVSIAFSNPTAKNVTLAGATTITGGTCGTSSVFYYLFDHTGAQIKSGSLSCGSSGTLYTMTALAAGSYTVQIVPLGLVYGSLGVKVTAS
ncbi:VWD domain-containing protein [Catenulispora yoronensis]|uniref:VWD domain-containing protein n=1 Tax=Catenulispora yoronensis TaxID=450799 RepID=UPI0031E249F8